MLSSTLLLLIMRELQLPLSGLDIYTHRDLVESADGQMSLPPCKSQNLRDRLL